MTGSLEVDLAPLGEAFRAGGERGADVARRLGWFDHRGVADGQRVHRALGVMPDYYTVRRGPRAGERTVGFRRTTSYERAVLLAEAIGVDPVEVGL